MTIWHPPTDIGETELVGRRLLDKLSTARATDIQGRPLLEVNDFFESRLKDDLSVDRLGDPNPNGDTLTAITDLAVQEAELRNPLRVFNGWATIRVREFRFTGWVAKVEARPTHRENGSIENRWHAEVSRDGFREKGQAYALAVTLQHTFERKGDYVSARYG